MEDQKKRGRLLDDPHDVAFFHHQQFFAFEVDFGAGPFAEQHLVADLDLRRADLAVVQHLAGADGDDLLSQLRGMPEEQLAALAAKLGLDASSLKG